MFIICVLDSILDLRKAFVCVNILLRELAWEEEIEKFLNHI